MRRKTEKSLSELDLMEILRQEGLNLLPPEGGWVCVLGNPFAPRGLRIPVSIHDLGVQHFDIYYAYDEGTPWKINFAGAEVFGLDTTLADTKQIVEATLLEYGVQQLQTTWVTLNTPVSQLIRMWNGEVRVFSDELIKELLAAGYIETIPFGEQKKKESPVWDEVTRDMIGSLQLDGLSYQQAQHELITAGVEFERDQDLPQYFYRPIGTFRATFSEEED